MTANAGYHAYATGDVLTAAQVQYNLQNQTVMYFATSAARTTAIGSVTVEGMVTYIPANGLEYYNGTAWTGVSNPGDITDVLAGKGLTGGGTSGSVTLALGTTAKGDLVAGSGTTTAAALTVGANNTVLQADSTQTTGLKYSTPAAVVGNIVTAKGDLIAATASGTVSNLAVGTNNQVLTADSTTTTGLKWATAASGGGMTLLSTTTLSGASTTISSISGSYKQLLVRIYGVTRTTSSNFTVKPNAGSNGNYIYPTAPVTSTVSYYSNIGSPIYVQTDSFLLLNTSADNAFTLIFDNYASTTNWKPFQYFGSFVYSGGTAATFAMGALQTNSAITSLEIANTSGTFNSGTVLVYGVS